MAEQVKPAVEYNFLSTNCGLKVSNLCYGAMTFGENKVGMRSKSLNNKLYLMHTQYYTSWVSGFNLICSHSVHN